MSGRSGDLAKPRSRWPGPKLDLADSGVEFAVYVAREGQEMDSFSVLGAELWECRTTAGGTPRTRIAMLFTGVIICGLLLELLSESFLAAVKSQGLVLRQ